MELKPAERKQEPAGKNPFRFWRWAVGNLDRDMSLEEKRVFVLMSKLFKKQDKTIASHSLKLILHWVQSHVKGLNTSMAFTAELWDEVGVRLWDWAKIGDKTAAGFLPIWRAILETLKTQQGARKE